MKKKQMEESGEGCKIEEVTEEQEDDESEEEEQE